MSVIAIACVDVNWGIGYKGELLERIPADMKFFKKTTTNGIVIMGRNTWKSLNYTPLINRENIVITNSLSNLELDNTKFMTLEEAIKVIDFVNSKDIYIIGGASIYSQLLPYCDKTYITKVFMPHKNVDAYFPNLDQMEDEWELTEESNFQEYNGFYYAFQTYERR